MQVLWVWRRTSGLHIDFRVKSGSASKNKHRRRRAKDNWPPGTLVQTCPPHTMMITFMMPIHAFCYFWIDTVYLSKNISNHFITSPCLSGGPLREHDVASTRWGQLNYSFTAGLGPLKDNLRSHGSVYICQPHTAAYSPILPIDCQCDSLFAHLSVRLSTCY